MIISCIFLVLNGSNYSNIAYLLNTVFVYFTFRHTVFVRTSDTFIYLLTYLPDTNPYIRLQATL